MFTREEKSALRQKFWTAFGKYMSPVPAASGERINWINYNSGIKGITIRSDADEHSALVKLDIKHRDADLQAQHVSMLRTLYRDLPPGGFSLTQNEEGTLMLSEKPGVNIFREADWPEIISFLKRQLIVIDSFWFARKDLFL